MAKPKLILLNGFAGAGKSTIARMYIDEHPMALAIESDELIVNMGAWLAHEDEARALVFALAKTMLRTYLSSGHDVVLPYLVTDANEVEELELIASDINVEFHEIILYMDHATAIDRLLQRGTWGEAGQPPLTEKDMPIIEELYSKMEAALAMRRGTQKIVLQENNPKHAYSQLLQIIQTSGR